MSALEWFARPEVMRQVRLPPISGRGSPSQMPAPAGSGGTTPSISGWRLGWIACSRS